MALRPFGPHDLLSPGFLGPLTFLKTDTVWTLNALTIEILDFNSLASYTLDWDIVCFFYAFFKIANIKSVIRLRRLWVLSDLLIGNEQFKNRWATDKRQQMIKFVFSKKNTKIDEIFSQLLINAKSTVKILSIVAAFLVNMNFICGGWQ